MTIYRRVAYQPGAQARASERRFPWRLYRCLRFAVRRQCGVDNCLVRIHVGDARDADARRLDDVDGVDADARTNGDRGRCVVPCMWVVMMAAMMLPSLAPMLWRYRQAVRLAAANRASDVLPCWWVSGTSSFGPCSDWPCFPWAPGWRRFEMERPGLARAVPLRSHWSCSSPADSSSTVEETSPCLLPRSAGTWPHSRPPTPARHGVGSAFRGSIAR